MDTFARIVVYSAVGLILLLLNIAYVVRVAAEWRKGPATPIVPPLGLIGKAEASNDGAEMAKMVIARVAHINQQFRESARLLDPDSKLKKQLSKRSQKPMLSAVIPLLAVDSLHQLRQFDANVSVGGVEVSGFFSWLHRSLTAERVIDITVNYGEATAVASLSPTVEGGDAVWVDVEKATDDAVIDNVAYAVHKRLIDKQMPAWQELSVPEYRELVGILTAAADLNRRHDTVNEEDYRKVSVRADAFIGGSNLQWEPLRDLAAQLAQNADKPEVALALLQDALAEAPKKAKPAIQEKVDEASRRVVVKTTAAAAVAAAQPQAEAVEALEPMAKFHRATLAPPMQGAPLVAVIGPPPGSLLDYESSLPESAPKLRLDEHFTSRMAGLSALIRTIAPTARVAYVWKDADGSADAEPQMTSANLAASLEEARAAKPGVILFAYGPLEEGEPAFAELFRRIIGEGIVVVLPAGNDRKKQLPFETNDLQEQLAIVSAVDTLGQPAPFTSSGAASLWALGMNLPIARDRKVSLRNGTSFAAAIAAGAATRIRDANPDLTPADVVRVLKASSRA
ncbi:MAG TPA: S8/S53 family peptidase, partial [Thermoanaerobaculia bacterium]|nr:S8/S53 family peptidase [Thermoanaerobaculia bacterium]